MRSSAVRPAPSPAGGVRLRPVSAFREGTTACDPRRPRAARTPSGLRRLQAGALLTLCFIWGCGGQGEGTTDTTLKQPAPGGTQPHLVLVTLDTTRADHLGAYGARPPSISPVFDAVARRGTLFLACDSASPLTLPSHATLLTGLLPPEHGLRVNGNGRLPESVPTLATHLASAGYRTGAFLGSVVLHRRHGLGRGFDIYDDGFHGEERSAALTVDNALAWWDRGDSPTFLWVHLFDAHSPYRPPPPYSENDDPYAGEIAFADAQLGRLTEGVEAATGGRPLVLAVVGDHGEGRGEHGEAEHGLLLYQSTLRVPLALAGDGVPAGKRVADPVRTQDLPATLLSLLGRPAGEGCGRDLLAGGEASAPADCEAGSYAETLLPLTDYGWSPLHSMRDGRHKLIAGAFVALHDLDLDPGEREGVLFSTEKTRSSPPGPAGDLLSRIRRLQGGSGRRAEGTLPDLAHADRLRRLGYLAASPSDAGETGDRPDPREQTAFHRRVRAALADYRDGLHEKAAARLDRLHREQPDNPLLLDLSGSVEMALGRPAAAAIFYRKALTLRPAGAELMGRLAEALLAAGDAAGAESWARRAREGGDRSDRIAVVLCRALLQRDALDEAAHIAAVQLQESPHGDGPLRQELRRLTHGDAAD